MNRSLTAFALCALFSLASYATETQHAQTEQEKYMAWAKSLWISLDRKTGEIKLDNGVATLNVPKDYYYLNPQDAEKILAQVWGNPPGSKTLGMILPSDSTPFDQHAWGVTVQYEEEGYVTDKDANTIDYDDLLKKMQAETHEASEARKKQGYDTIELVGWASKPYYDQATHKLHWAKEIQFGHSAEHTLNYNIRVLGRKGVLVMTFIAGIAQKEMIKNKVDSVMAMANFDTGQRYEDFNPSLDKVAAYGIGALVAGKVIAKTGLLAALFIFLKKFGIVIAVAIAGLFGKFFKRKPKIE